MKSHLVRISNPIFWIQSRWSQFYTFFPGVIWQCSFGYTPEIAQEFCHQRNPNIATNRERKGWCDKRNWIVVKALPSTHCWIHWFLSRPKWVLFCFINCWFQVSGESDFLTKPFRTFFIVMEFCESGDLYTKINKQKGKLFPENVILHYFVQLCKAVQVWKMKVSSLYMIFDFLN